MKFYNRKDELNFIKKLEKLSHKNSQMLFITGRRRIGKTRLIFESFKDKRLIYFFVSKKDEKLLCEEFAVILKDSLKMNIIGKFDRFSELFEIIMKTGENSRIIFAIDEFQEFFNINPSVFSDIQRIWDKYKDRTKVFLILSGSIYTLMKKIFEDSKEPLYGRASGKIVLDSLNIKIMKKILQDHNKKYTKEDLLSFYIFTGGIPKYIEIFVEQKALTFDKMLDLILSPYSYFIDEGREVLIEEFGKEYKTYFSILSLIASSKTSRTEIESILGKDVGGYLSLLENDYGIIRKVRPILSKPNSRIRKYYIIDNFLNFWFRFIYKYRTLVETKNFKLLKSIIKRDFAAFSGIMLERYFREKIILSGKYTEIGSYWERGNKNEIDIVAINSIEKRALIADVKMKREKLNLKILKSKSSKISEKLKGYEINYKGFSLKDM